MPTWFYIKYEDVQNVINWHAVRGELLDNKKSWNVNIWRTTEDVPLMDLTGRGFNERDLSCLLDEVCPEYKHVEESGIVDNYILSTFLAGRLRTLDGWISHAPWMLSEGPEVMLCKRGLKRIKLVHQQKLWEYAGLSEEADLSDYVDFIQREIGGASNTLP
jgi:hypothetical protein